MNPIHNRAAVLDGHLAAALTVADPDLCGPLAVFPLIAAGAPSFGYVSFAEGVQHGVAIKEVAQAAQVNDLVVNNPLDLPVLLYEGEQVVGARQDRTFDVSALVPAHGSLRVPVSCVEAGRWQADRHHEPFAPAHQTAYPQLRKLKNQRMREHAAQGLELRADQGEVWSEIAAKQSRHGVYSATGAMDALVGANRALVEQASRQITMKCSQVGALVAIGQRFVVLDYVSEPDVFDALLPALVRGYALDAIEVTDPGVSPSLDDARDFVDLLMRAPFAARKAVGLGNALTFDFGGLAGSGLSHEDEVVALTAFADDQCDQPARADRARAVRVNRPSRRRA